MEGAPISLILDVVILVLLGLTIVYAARLSIQLKRLRDSKSDLDKIVRELIKNIDKADRAVAGMKESAREAGGDLQSAIDRAVGIADELEVVNDSANRVAAKLETLLDTARPMTANTRAPAPTPAPAQQQVAMAGSAEQPSAYAQHLRKLEGAEEKAAVARTNSFAIRDGDAERGVDPLAIAQSDEDSQALYSDAERDLFKAMKGRAKS